ncbi:MAG: PSD1 and planctomycete cytochrome C domain-containing protein [Limisphaerales bacterium]
MKAACSTAWSILGSLLCFQASGLSGHATESSAQLVEAQAGGETIDFTTTIAPILSDHCFFCHGPDSAERQAGLRLDTATGATQDLGGTAAIVPGDIQASELIARIRSTDPDEQMPPPETGKALNPDQIMALETWIAQGAPYQEHWAYKQPIRPSLPEVVDTKWPRGAIDAFILSKLEKRGLTPSPEADPETLARRVHLDLTGLPPTRRDMERFRAMKDMDREWSHYVDQLLSRPSHGERLAVFWLDLVRFADTVGYHGDQDHSISPYRDYVIKAFNENMPFDQFTLEQLAGDLLPDATLWQRVASGYNRLLQTSHEGGVQDKEYLAKYAADRVRNFGLVWLGATTGCAECHNHKYDPFTQANFYELAAFFADLKQQGAYNASNTIPTTRLPEIKAWNLSQYAQWEALEKALSKVSDQAHLDKTDQRVLEQRMQALEASFAPCMVSESMTPRPTRVLPRGNWLDESGQLVSPSTPSFLPPMRATAEPSRLDLAQWLFEAKHPLTGRVLMNRLWKLFFGEGLSRVVEDLGAQGSPPSHPQLLDWLAVEFEASGWDIRHMIRLMVHSRAYRQSSAINPKIEESDPDNRWLARQQAFRIQAEFVRDQALQVSGLLTTVLGGESAKPYQPQGYYQHLNFPQRSYEPDSGSQQYRRGVYTHWQRGFLHPMLKAFDAPSREEGTASRNISNTPLAALVLLNDPSFVEAAGHLAQRILREADPNPEGRIRWAWQEVLSREPTQAETQALMEFFEQESKAFSKNPSMAQQWISSAGLREFSKATNGDAYFQIAPWMSVARALLNLHESMTRY